jgi:UDP-2-acetamido-3-amino-2,3-dideoxy-glucuronate N-acetyltransferase
VFGAGGMYIMTADFIAHPSTDISPRAKIGAGTRIWHGCQVRENAVIGRNCVLSKDVYVDAGVRIGDNVKVQNGVSIYHGVTLEDGVFCGPHCVFTNDRLPRAVNPDGSPKTGHDWTLGTTLVRAGASIGAHATVVCGVTVGRWAMVGAGAVVTHDVPDYGLVYGNPARLRGFVCPCGEKMGAAKPSSEANEVSLRCPRGHAAVSIPRGTYEHLQA